MLTYNTPDEKSYQCFNRSLFIYPLHTTSLHRMKSRWHKFPFRLCSWWRTDVITTKWTICIIVYILLHNKTWQNIVLSQTWQNDKKKTQNDKIWLTLTNYEKEDDVMKYDKSSIKMGHCSSIFGSWLGFGFLRSKLYSTRQVRGRDKMKMGWTRTTQVL
jgi:hypothetical protein